MKKLAQLTCQNPEALELLFSSPDSCSNLDLLPRSSAQAQLIGRQSSEHAKQRAYPAHPRELGSQSPEEDMMFLAQHCIALPEHLLRAEKMSTMFLGLCKNRKMTACTKSQRGSREWQCRTQCTVPRDPAVMREMTPTMYQGGDLTAMCILLKPHQAWEIYWMIATRWTMMYLLCAYCQMILQYLPPCTMSHEKHPDT